MFERAFPAPRIRYERLGKHVSTPCQYGCPRRASWIIEVGEAGKRSVCGHCCRRIHERWRRSWQGDLPEKEPAVPRELEAIARQITGLGDRLRLLGQKHDAGVFRPPKGGAEEAGGAPWRSSSRSSVTS
jgi:hypothetical protein